MAQLSCCASARSGRPWSSRPVVRSGAERTPRRRGFVSLGAPRPSRRGGLGISGLPVARRAEGKRMASVGEDCDSEPPVDSGSEGMPRGEESDDAVKIVIIGGTGAVGSAAAIHLLKSWSSPIQLLLAGRDPGRGAARAQEVVQEAGGAREMAGKGHTVEFRKLDWRDKGQLRAALDGTTVVIHTAGPYGGQQPEILEACIAMGIPCYVDLADPLEYIEAARRMSERAAAGKGGKKGQAGRGGTMALLASGAFPGFSNLLAMECASRLDLPVRDLDFRYFTAGLGGSGPVNLLITNQGFGDPVPKFKGGRLSPELVAGLEAERVEFFIDETDESATRVGERTVWSWPFPEVATVAETLNIANGSTVKMGTAPEAWNTIMGWLVQVVPRALWRNRRFCQWMADFSEPMVRLTDKFVGETHCMRVDVFDTDGNVSTAVQGHDSFRRVVGQSCAEFAMDLLQRTGPHAPASTWRPGVYLPEQLMTDKHIGERRSLLQRLAKVPGTFTCRFSLPAPEEQAETTG